ncbi:hypothetical protein ACHAWF_006081 [Thalassiosira exigua]
MSTLGNVLVFGGAVCCAGGADALLTSSSGRARRIAAATALRSSNGGPGPGPGAGRRRPLEDPFAPQQARANAPPPQGPRRSFEEPPSIDLDGRVRDGRSNLFRPRQSVNEDPRGFDMERRFSQRPVRAGDDDPSMQPRQAWWDAAPSSEGRIQGGSRRTYDAPFDRDASHVFLESDGRPLDVELELWDGPNNTPTKMRVYSEDGRMRPVNAMVENPMGGSQGGSMRGNTLSVRNTGPMEFPINAGVSSVGAGRPMMPPSGVRDGGLADKEGAYLSERDLDGFTRPSSPSMARGETVQGEALRTFPLDYSVEAVQVTITTDGLPMNAKVELWGTSSHIKQLAEIYNDNGQARPFACIIDVPGGSNTIAVYNTGPMEYPIRVVVEPVARMDGWDGREEKFGGQLAPW